MLVNSQYSSWYIAIPVTVGLILILMRQVIVDWCKSLFQRRQVWTVRKRRRADENRAKTHRRTGRKRF